MVRTVTPTGRLFTVTVVVFRESGVNSMVADHETEIGSDAFDYATQAQGYFRFAIAEMADARRIEVAVEFCDQLIELIEITRD